MMVDYAFQHDGVLIMLSCSNVGRVTVGNPYLGCGDWIALASPAAKGRLLCSFAASSVLYNSISTETARISCFQLL